MTQHTADTGFRGVLVATPVPFHDDLSPDLDRYADHIRWLADAGCRGVCPNSSAGEYVALSDEERAAVVHAAVEAAPEGFLVVPGVGSPSGHESRRWAERAAAEGAHGVLAPLPDTHRADRQEALAHFAEVAAAGLPVIVSNEPAGTGVDLTPDVLGEIADLHLVVGVAESSGDVRRVPELAERAPGLEVFAGADDLLHESLLMGAVGWVARLPNVFPAECARLFRLDAGGRAAEALRLYRALLPALRWGSRPGSVQAVKLGMEAVGRYGGPVRLPRLPLPPDLEVACRQDLESVKEALEARGGGPAAPG